MDVFKKNREEIQLVFSDVILPDKNGPELVSEILLIKPDIKVLMASGYIDQKSHWTTIQEKGYPFLQKPYSIYELLSSIKEILRR